MPRPERQRCSGRSPHNRPAGLLVEPTLRLYILVVTADCELRGPADGCDGRAVVERGYAATSPRDVMTRAGAGQGSMYHHFSGKHELAVQALSAVTRENEGRVISVGWRRLALEQMKRYLSLPRPGTGVPGGSDDPGPGSGHGCRTDRSRCERLRHHAEPLGAGDHCRDCCRRTSDEHRPGGSRANAGSRPAGGYVLARAQGEQGPMDAAVRGAISCSTPPSPLCAPITDQPRKRNQRPFVPESTASAARSQLPAAALRGDADVEIVAINDIADAATLASFLEGLCVRSSDGVEVDGDAILVAGKRIRVTSEREPSLIPWRAERVDVVIESTG
ncbi:unnamed protein product, partial [Mesorhabditis spiculigera]